MWAESGWVCVRRMCWSRMDAAIDSVGVALSYSYSKKEEDAGVGGGGTMASVSKFKREKKDMRNRCFWFLNHPSILCD